MNKYFVFGLIALCIASASAGRIVREAPAAPTTASSITKLVDGVEEVFGKLHTSFLDLMGVKDNTELINLVDVQSRTYATKLQGIVADLTETAKKNSGNADGLINEVKTKILTTIREIEAKNPQLVTDSKKYQEEFEGQLRSVMAETEKFREKISGEGGEVLDRFSKVAKELYETTVTTATGYSTQVQEKLKEKP